MLHQMRLVCNKLLAILTKWKEGETMPLEEQLDEARTRVTKAIKTEMIKQDVTQSEMAKQLNVSRGVVSRAVNGDNNPQSIQIRKTIYKLLGMEGE